MNTIKTILLKAYRWPVAVVCFSPFAGDIITKVIAVFK